MSQLLKNVCLYIIVGSFILLSGQCYGQNPDGDEGNIAWDMDKLSSPPKLYDSPLPDADGVKALFYEGLPYKGEPTRVFAWYGVPENDESKPFPAVVCVHGGGGTAMKSWVRYWNQHGYAAIAMDQEGRLPTDSGARFETKSSQQHQWHGPDKIGIFGDIAQPVSDLWMCHAVADVILANSLLRSFPEIDPDKIGLTGISWGGIVINVVMGVDNRFKFAIPVYGCSFLYESENHYQQTYEKMSPANAAKCREYCDGSGYLANAKMPSLWINGTNDKHFYLPIFQKSFNQTSGQRTACIRVEMRHGHGYGWEVDEIYAFADSIVNNGTKLIEILSCVSEQGIATVRYKSETQILKAELNYTKDSSPWYGRKWDTLEASIEKQNIASAKIPEGTTVCFFNLTDVRGLLVSSEYIELK